MNFGKKSKGFIFSADAAFAIILILAIVGILLVGEKTRDPSGDSLKLLDSKTRDYSVVGFYLNKNAATLTNPIASIVDFGKDSAKCNSINVLGLDGSQGQNYPVQKKFCDAR